MAEENVASLMEVRDFFGYPNSKTFREDWVQVARPDQLEIKELLFEELHPSE